MLGLLDKQPWPSSPKLGRMAPPRLFSRRTIAFLVIFGTFMTFLILTSSQLGQICEDGSYCDFSTLRQKLPNFGNGNASHIGNGNESASVIDDQCAHFPNTSSVLTVMKTGASEAYSKVPTQLMTTLKCVPDFLIFSDMAQKIAGFTVHDSLETVLPEIKESNKDFELYFRQQQCPIDQEQCNKNHNTAQQGWELDKYKNIHMAEKTYAMRPNYEWYLFIDADTYVAYATLMSWLQHLNPAKPHYIGSVAMLAGFPFGHGGSGYLVSQAAMSAMFKGKTGVANKYDEPVQHTCCGDYMWSKALKDETNVAVVNAWPVINGEKPHTLPYAEDGWCHPIATMHHAAAQDISDVYAFERERKFSAPLRIKDLYHQFVRPEMTDTRPDWDNMSEDVFYLNSTAAEYEEWELDRAKKEGLSDLELMAHHSFSDCKNLCHAQDKCLQFQFQKGICSLSRKFRHGKPVKREKKDFYRSMSGWDMTKIKAWVEENDACEEPFDWPIKDY